MLSFCRDLRLATETPIIGCALAHDASLVVRALQAGADDVFVLPMQTAEFVARVRAVLRRVRRASDVSQSPDRIVAGDVELCLREHRVYRNGRMIDLTPTEFRLLAVLARDSGRAISHKSLLKQAWGADYDSSRAMLRIYIRRLRAKLGDNLTDPALIVAVRGVGYRFEPAVIAAPSAA
jgi:DNA-binding response OmpR family regulator